MVKKSKRWKEILKEVDVSRVYQATEVMDFIKGAAKAKFDETIEVAFCLGINPKHADQQVRNTVTLPEGTGQK